MRVNVRARVGVLFIAGVQQCPTINDEAKVKMANPSLTNIDKGNFFVYKLLIQAFLLLPNPPVFLLWY